MTEVVSTPISQSQTTSSSSEVGTKKSSNSTLTNVSHEATSRWKNVVSCIKKIPRQLGSLLDFVALISVIVIVSIVILLATLGFVLCWSVVAGAKGLVSGSMLKTASEFGRKAKDVALSTREDLFKWFEKKTLR